MSRIILVVLFTLHVSFGARMLAFFPFPIKSHHIVFRSLMKGLADKGHELTYVTPIPLKEPHDNITQIVVDDLGKDLHELTDIDGYRELSILSVSQIFLQLKVVLGDKMYSSKPVQNIIHTDEKFDVILFETFMLQEAVSALAHKFDAATVEVAALGEHFWANELAGLPDNPSYMMDFNTEFTDEMDFFQRIHNAYIKTAMTLYSYYTLPVLQRQMDTFFNYSGWESRPPIFNLLRDKDLILVNSHLATGYSFPKAPHVKEIGGINIVPITKQTINNAMARFIDEAKDGLVYFSFGSIVNMTEMIEETLRDSIMKTFATSKLRVLWKWDSDVTFKVPANVMLAKWFPQQEILAHKNTKLFITHGGYMSLNEAVYYGVPLIGIPFFVDQPKNMKLVQKSGNGILLERENLTGQSLKWAINEVVNNPRYKAEAVRRSELFKDRPMTPLNEAIYWIEYVLKHKKALQPRAVHLSFYVLYNLDVIATFLIVLFVFFVILKKLCRLLLCRSSRANDKMKSKKD